MYALVQVRGYLGIGLKCLDFTEQSGGLQQPWSPYVCCVELQHDEGQRKHKRQEEAFLHTTAAAAAAAY